MGRYIVKCDMCKKTIKTTNNVVESYQGGTCSSCRNISVVKDLNKRPSFYKFKTKK
ncbi:MAG TPA: hypothetical protein VMZ91_08660 [Candidatus Paceibacterota bacterium]|nr:hypothetical protein [Candidatus Paceibacterota bacterium]